MFDLDTGRAVRTVAYKTQGPRPGWPSRPTAKTLALTCTETITLVDFAGPVRSATSSGPAAAGGKCPARCSPRTAGPCTFRLRPMAYDVATGKRKWQGIFPTVHSVAMKLSDVSPDGSVILCLHGHSNTKLNQ